MLRLAANPLDYPRDGDFIQRDHDVRAPDTPCICRISLATSTQIAAPSQC
jgi:hypothetical protein